MQAGLLKELIQSTTKPEILQLSLNQDSYGAWGSHRKILVGIREVTIWYENFGEWF
jgi:hypothetical protein